MVRYLKAIPTFILKNHTQMERKEILKKLAIIASGNGQKALTAQTTLTLIAKGQSIDDERILAFLESDIPNAPEGDKQSADDALKQRMMKFNDVCAPLVEQYMDFIEKERDEHKQFLKYVELENKWKQFLKKNYQKPVYKHYVNLFEQRVAATVKMVVEYMSKKMEEQNK
jgi:hypothetical protein